MKNDWMGLKEKCDVCGPDITGSFLESLKKIAKKVGKYPKDQKGWIEGTIYMKKIGDNLDFQVGDVEGCAMGKCANTVSFAGQCINHYQANNILYGFVGRILEIPYWILRSGAQVHEWIKGGGIEMIQASSYTIGWRLAVDDIFQMTETSFTKWVKSQQGYFSNLLQYIGENGKYQDCKACNKKAKPSKVFLNAK